jgi:hypothetical protein
MEADFALRADWHLRAAPTQCELSDQEVATPQAPAPDRRDTANVRTFGRWRWQGAGKDQGGR